MGGTTCSRNASVSLTPEETIRANPHAPVGFKVREKLSQKDRQQQIQRYVAGLREHKKNLKDQGACMMGYPLNQKKSEIKDLVLDALGDHWNNLGDPWQTKGQNLHYHTKFYEQELIKKLAFPWIEGSWEDNVDNVWGYITAGGTEGSFMGIQRGLQVFGHHENITCCFSEDTHYCGPKACQLLNIRVQPIKSNDDGSINLEDLQKHVENEEPTQNFIFFLNLGTTIRCGFDDVHGVHKMMEHIGLARERTHIHLDGALCAGYWEHTNGPKYKIPKDIDSVSISGHKWWGANISGFFLRRTFDDAPPNMHNDKSALGDGDIKYVATRDTVFGGSRSGDNVCIWLGRLLAFDWEQEYAHAMEMVKYFKEQLEAHDIPYKLNEPYSTTFYDIPFTTAAFAYRWNLARTDSIVHVIIMPHVTPEKIDLWMKEYVESREQNGEENGKADFQIDQKWKREYP